MDYDLVITKCLDCGRYSHRYNYEPCPICLSQNEKERLEREKQSFDKLKKELELNNH